eukprot:5926189-Amphidinium_carterae.2
MFNNALTLVHCACDHKRSVCWEWPRFSELWNAGVASELQQLGLKPCDIDGCAFNLSVQGELVKKPWRLVTNDGALMRGLMGKCCVGGPTHKQCRRHCQE